MSQIADLVNAFVTGSLDSAEFAEHLEELARHEPDALAQIRELIEEQRHQGILPASIHARVEAEIEAVEAGSISARPPPTGTKLKAGRQRDEADTGTRLQRADANAARAVDTPSEPEQTTQDQSEPPLRIEDELRPDALIKQRFLLREQIGEGGMGVVFKARDQEYEGHEQYVAIKFLSSELLDRPEALRALEGEVRKTHELAHPNIVTVYDFYRDHPFYFISMEFLEGEPLDHLLRRIGPHGFPFADAWPIIEAAGTALAYAHEQGIIHSDFKPGNVFITRQNRVKVLDFGIARAARVDSDEFDVTVLGGLTPAYASPEMVLDFEPDPRDDVYALACVAYELLSGRHPFNGMPAHRAQHTGMVVPRIDGLARPRMRALRRGLAFTRDARTPSVRDFLAELEAAPQRDRFLRPAGVATLGALAVIGGGTYLYSSMQHCSNMDAAFLESLRLETPENVDPETRNILVELGQENLMRAREQFNPRMLSTGVSDAFGAFSNVLRIDPDNTAAAEGILEIFEIYEAEAERLYGLGDAEGSVAIADYGLELHPQHCGLNDIRERAAAELE